MYSQASDAPIKSRAGCASGRLPPGAPASSRGSREGQSVLNRKIGPKFFSRWHQRSGSSHCYTGVVLYQSHFPHASEKQMLQRNGVRKLFRCKLQESERGRSLPAAIAVRSWLRKVVIGEGRPPSVLPVRANGMSGFLRVVLSL